MDMMKMLLSKVREEMEDACEYATTAEMIKAESPNTAKVLMSLSEQERSHATMLIQEAKNLGHTGEDKALCHYEMEVMQAKDDHLKHKWDKVKKGD